MKKFILLLVTIVLSLTLLGCSQSEYKVDGTFTAYEVSTHFNGTPQVTSVSVSIENGEIVAYDIDVRQGSSTETDTAGEYSFAWNELTKKELMDDYGMKNAGSEYEWYEQAEMIEAFWLENGIEAMETEEGAISNIAGVSIKDAYSAIALEAVANAKAGKFQAFICESGYNIDFIFASMMVDEDGVVTELMLDVLQGNASGTEFAWDDKTKQEKGDDYGMTNAGAEYEWYEQANMLTDYIMTNGWNGDLVSIDGSGISTDGTNSIESLSGVTMGTDGYLEVLEDLFDLVD